MKLKFIIILVILFSYKSIWSQTKTDSTKIIKVLSFNILHGATTKGDFNLDVLANLIKKADPDFVALQEVDFKTNRAHKYDLTTELAWRTKLVPLFGKAMDFDSGEYGEGILSKYTFMKTRNVSLPYTSGNEPRAALEILASIPSNDTIAFIGTHLDHLKDETDRIAQIEKINTAFTPNTYPSILAGDLNDVPGSKAIKLLEEHWLAAYDKTNPAPTYPSGTPTKKIDYVLFYPKNRWKVLEAKVINDPIASDHCAYLVVVELLEE